MQKLHLDNENKGEGAGQNDQCDDYMKQGVQSIYYSPAHSRTQQTGRPPCLRPRALSAKAAFHFVSYTQVSLHYTWKFAFIDMKELITTRDIITRQEMDL